MNKELINDQKNIIYISLGNYCLCSLLLKKHNLKAESHPFDWMITCIDNIIHVLNDDFKEFVNKENYEIENNRTKNTYYFNNTIKLFITEKNKTDHQHHNLLNNNNESYSYLLRCIDRFKTVNERFNQVNFILIQPLYLNKLEDNTDKIIELYNTLHKYYNNNINMKLFVFNIIEKNNKNFNHIKIFDDKIEIINLNTEMIKGLYGMYWFDDKGEMDFLKIIQSL